MKKFLCYNTKRGRHFISTESCLQTLHRDYALSKHISVIGEIDDNGNIINDKQPMKENESINVENSQIENAMPKKIKIPEPDIVEEINDMEINIPGPIKETKKELTNFNKNGKQPKKEKKASSKRTTKRRK